MISHYFPIAERSLRPIRENCGRVIKSEPQSVARIKRSLRLNYFLAIVAGALSLLAATGANAGKPVNITNDELALLPAYCMDVQTIKYGDAYFNTSPNAAKWVSLMGKGFWHMHHYCWALINLARVQKPGVNSYIRQSMREYAIGDMEYVIENTTDDFIMLPEIYTKMGEVLLSLKRAPEAFKVFAKARTLKPDYWPPYFYWGQYLLQTGQKVQARQLVEEGLGYAPQAKLLRNLLVELGGDPASVPTRPVPEKTTGQDSVPTQPAPEKPTDPKE